MTSYSQFSQYNQPSSSPESLFNSLKRTSPLSPPVQTHLYNVYFFLAVLGLASAAGSYIHMAGIFGGGVLSMLAGIGCILALLFATPTRQNERYRKSLGMGVAFFQGMSIGPMLSTLDLVGLNHITFQALASTALIFGCFSIASMFSARRSVMYAMGMFGSLVSVFSWLQLWNVFLGSRTTMSMELYLGLVVFSGYVVFDTQVIIAKAESGVRDVVTDALNLYVDVVQLFVRLVAILSKREAEAREREERKRRNVRR